MLRTTILACLLVGFSATANADAPKEKGFYIGAAGGLSIYDDDGAFGRFDDEDNSLQVQAGYKFFPYVATELRHVDIGSFSLGFGGSNIDFSVTTVQVVGMFPFFESGWEIFGSLGLGSLDIGLSGGIDIDDGTVFGGGIGVRFHPTPSFSIGVQTDAYVWEDSDFYNMAVGGTQLSINYIF